MDFSLTIWLKLQLFINKKEFNNYNSQVLTKNSIVSSDKCQKWRIWRKKNANVIKNSGLLLLDGLKIKFNENQNNPYITRYNPIRICSYSGSKNVIEMHSKVNGQVYVWPLKIKLNQLLFCLHLFKFHKNQIYPNTYSKFA
jgi:hypothetical protein